MSYLFCKGKARFEDLNAARMSAACEGLTEQHLSFRPFPGGNAYRSDRYRCDCRILTTFLTHVKINNERRWGYGKGLCPKAEKLYDEMMSLPLYYGMTNQDAKDVIAAVKKIVDYHRK